MGNSRINNETTMGSSTSWRSIFNNRKFPCSGIRCDKHNTKNNKYRKYKHIAKYLLAINFIFFSPVKANTVSSPSASSSGTVINNGYQTINGGFPTMFFGGGVQCQQTTLAVNPFITLGENYQTPEVLFTETNIYDLSEDANGNLVNPGTILYTARQPRLQQTTHNFNYGITLSLQIPLGEGTDLCLEAARNQIEGQQFALDKARLEANLARMKICAEQLKLGVMLVGEDAVTCRNVVLTTIPNQVVPHTHEIELND